VIHKEHAISTQPIIRPAQPPDVHAISALLAALYREEQAAHVHTPQSLAEALFGREPPVQLYGLVAVDADAIVGVVLYYRGYDVASASSGFHLADMVVAPTARRRGVGKQLVARLAEQCLAAQGQWLSLTVLRANIAAHGFYRALAFTFVDVDFCAMGLSGLRRISSTLPLN